MELKDKAECWEVFKRVIEANYKDTKRRYYNLTDVLSLVHYTEESIQKDSEKVLTSSK
jgi:hypothetical protein